MQELAIKDLTENFFDATKVTNGKKKAKFIDFFVKKNLLI